MKIRKLMCILFMTLLFNVIKSEESKVKLDLTRKVISFPFEFVSNTEMLEVLACTYDGPTHETVVVIDPIGPALFEAMKSLDLKEALQWKHPLKSGYDLSMGHKLTLKMKWKEGDKERSVDVEDLLQYTGTKVPMIMRGWSFKGDMVQQEGKMKAPEHIEISLLDKGRRGNPAVSLVNPTNFLNLNEPEFQVRKEFSHLFKKLMNKEKTKGIIELSPVTEVELVAKNLKRYPHASALFTKSLMYAKKIDALKSKYHEVLRPELLEIVLAGSKDGISEVKQKEMIDKYEKASIEAEILLKEIHLNYYQLALNEYELLKDAFAEKGDEIDFLAYTIDLGSFQTFLSDRNLQIAKLKYSLASFSKDQKNLKDLAFQKIKLLRHENIARELEYKMARIKEGIENDKAQLENEEIKKDDYRSDIFLKQKKGKEHELVVFEAKLIYINEKKKYFKALSENQKDVDLNKTIEAIKKGILKTNIAKSEEKIFYLKDRKKNLINFLEEDPKDKVYYDKKIKEVEDQIIVEKNHRIKCNDRLKNIKLSSESLAAFEKEFESRLPKSKL